ncbi:MAG: thermonuclease family protein [Rickettsiales bacterium]|jgi:endonuclease YncB( thermonuclease family)|nr:thermonuclease family protein [Rickettsiales bacterium]
MKKLLFIICCSLFIAPAMAAMPPLQATVGYIIDGDTFSAGVKLENGAEISVRVRIINIDAPEIHGMCDAEIKMAQKAKYELEKLIPVGGAVMLSEIKDDKYLGRIDARVRTADNTDVGQVMIDRKLARKYSGGRRAGWCN